MALYLEKDELKDAYQSAKDNADDFFKPFDEYERLADNKIRTDLPKNMPRVNDGSLAALLVEAPNSILNGQEPTGTVKVIDRDEAWLGELANIEWQSEITKKANTQADFHSKCAQVVEKALWYGSQPTVSLFTQRGNYTGADFYLPYIKNVKLEPGKVSDQDSDVIWVDTWYTKQQIKTIIKQGREEDKLAKEEKRESNNPWKLAELQKVLDEDSQTKKESSEQNRVEREGKNVTLGFKFMACYQRGVEAPFYMIDSNGKCVRQWTNQDPTGDIPVHFMYCHQNLVNPYGKGKIELAGGTQNVLDYFTQLHVLATQLGLQPPVQISGDRTQTNLQSMVFSPSQFWFTGNAEVKLMQTSSSVYGQFGGNYGLYKTQLMNSVGRTDGGSVSAESGNPQYSKTDAGVDAQTSRTDKNDGAIWKNFGQWFNNNAKSMINIHFANMQGTDIRKLMDDEKERLYKAAPEEFAVLQDTNELEIVWDNVRAQFEFELDPASNEIKDEKAQVEGLSVALEKMQDPAVQAALAPTHKVNMGEAYSTLFKKLGIDNIDKILIPITPEEQAKQEQMGMEQGMAQGGEEETQEEPPVDPALMQIMEQYGVGPEDAAVVSSARERGYPEEQVVQAIKGGLV